MTCTLRSKHSEIAAMVWDGMKPVDIADNLGVNRQVLSSYLFTHNLDPITRNWGWILENQGGMTVAAMARELGVGCPVLRKKLDNKKHMSQSGAPNGTINLALHSKWS